MSDSLPLPDATPRRNPLLTLLQPKVSIPLIVVLSLIGGPFIYRESRIAGLPDLGDPVDAATEAAGESQAGENALEEYMAACALLVPMTAVEEERVARTRTDDQPDLKEFSRWMVANEEAYARWKAGTTRKHAFPLRDSNERMPRELSASGLRSIATLVELHGQRHMQEGRLKEARDEYFALFRCGRHCNGGGTLLCRFVGQGLHERAASFLERWSRDERLSPQQIETALGDIQSEDREAGPFSRVLEAEFIGTTKSLERNLLPWADPLTETSRWNRIRMWLQNEPRISVLVVRQIRANVVEHIDRPRHERPPLLAGSELWVFDAAPETLGPNRLPARQIARYHARAPMVQDVWTSSNWFDDLNCEALSRQATLVVALAAQLHRRRFGSFPDAADELVEKSILAGLPFDPCSDKREPIRYRKDDRNITIWSVGTNLIDDGGSDRPLADFGGHADIVRVIPIANVPPKAP